MVQHPILLLSCVWAHLWYLPILIENSVATSSLQYPGMVKVVPSILSLVCPCNCSRRSHSTTFVSSTWCGSNPSGHDYFLWGLLGQLLCEPNRSFWSTSSLASIEWWHHESISKAMLEERHSSPKWGHSSHSIVCTSLSSHWCYCIKGRWILRDYILGMQYLALKCSKEDTVYAIKS